MGEEPAYSQVATRDEAPRITANIAKLPEIGQGFGPVRRDAAEKHELSKVELETCCRLLLLLTKRKNISEADRINKHYSVPRVTTISPDIGGIGRANPFGERIGAKIRSGAVS